MHCTEDLAWIGDGDVSPEEQTDIFEVKKAENTSTYQTKCLLDDVDRPTEHRDRHGPTRC